MVLVTGGTGLVGSHLLYHLLQSEDSIRATFRSKEKLNSVKHVFSYYTDNSEGLFSKIEWVESTLNDIPKLTDAFEGVTIVYHCAALVSFDPNLYHKLRRTNIEGTANIVNLCIANRVKKLCYVSSIATIGDSDNGEYANEDSAWNPEVDNNIYAITKYGAEMEIWRCSQEGVDVIIVNPGIIIGPGYWRQSSGSLIKRIYKGLKYYTNGNGSYIDVHDVVKIMITLMNSSIKNERFILMAEHLSFKEFSQKVAQELNVKEPNKEASNLLLQIAWRLDWLNYFFKRKYRRLTKHNVISITSKNYNSNEKIKQAINFSFKPISKSIKETCRYLLVDVE